MCVICPESANANRLPGVAVKIISCQHIYVSPVQNRTVDLNRKDIELLAYRLWEDGGRVIGTPEKDWYGAEQVLAYKTLYPAPAAVTCGIDDVATERQATAGWTFFMLPTAAVADFTSHASQLVPPGQSEFHAKKMNLRSEALHYERFLDLISKTIEAHPYSLACTVGADISWKSQFAAFAQQIIGSVLGALNISDNALAKQLLKVTPPIWTLLRLVRLVGPSVSMSLEIDADSTIAALPASIVEIANVHRTGTEVLARLANAYSGKVFWTSPRLAPDGSSISIIPSERSFMVQAADVVGNFALADACHTLGMPGEGRRVKSEIFRRVFGVKENLVQLASISGTEIELLAAGHIKFVASDHFYDV